MVQRYELSEEWGNPVMSEYDHGDWVKYEDYEKLEAAHAELQERYDLDVNTEGK